MLLDIANRELTIKIVYYGPALSGKTTNLKFIHQLAAARMRGELMTLDTASDRTIFFDLLGLRFRAADLTVKLKLFTVPGQVMHNSTRKLVLQGVDGVAFIADSQIEETQANNASFDNMRENLRENGMDPARIPVVIQFNKRDLQSIRSTEELERLALKGRERLYKSVAIRGEGVVETFFGALEVTWAELDARHTLAAKLGLSPAEFLDQARGLFPTVF